MTPLMDAVRRNQSDLIQILLEYGCDPHYTNSNGQTAFSIACKLGLIDIIRELLGILSRIDLSSENNYPSAIHWICESGNPQIVEMVLENGCDLYRIDRFGKMGPDYLLDHNPESVIAVFEVLIRNGYDLNQRKRCKHSLLFLFAVEAIVPNIDIINFLLNHDVAAFPDKFLDVIQQTWKPSVREFLQTYYDTEVLNPLDRS